MYTLTIPVKPFVRKYVINRYNCTIWKFTKADRLGKYFYALLQKQPRTPERYSKMGETLTIEIPVRHAHRKGVYLSQDDVNDFNDFIYDELVDGIVEFYLNIQASQGMKKYDRLYLKQNIRGVTKTKQIQSPVLSQFFEYKEIINDYLLKFDISEDDLPFETIRKNVSRKIERLATQYKSAS